MRTKMTHRLLALLLTIVTVLPLLALDGLATTAAAIDGSTYAGIIETEKLSSIRYSDPTGLRFLSSVNRAWLEEIYDHKQAGRIEDFSFGTYIAPADYFTDGVTWDSLESGKRKLDVEADYGAYYTAPDLDPEKTYVVGSIVNIYRKNYNRTFRATGYVRIVLLDGTVVEYLGGDHEACVAETASKVINADNNGEYLIPDGYLSTLKQFIQPTDKEMNVTNLQTNQTHNPLGIDDANPVLSWELTSASRAVSQMAYRVVVSSELVKLNAGEYDMWDSGRVESSEVMTKYAGAALAASARYYWTVFVWNQDGVLCLPSTYACFEMGLLDGSDWEGTEWISIDPSDKSLGAMRQLTSYIIEFDTTVVTERMGVVFGAVDGNSCYMWQIYADKGQLIPHVRVNGTWSYNNSTVPAVTMDPATILGEGKTSFKNEPLHVKIQVDNGTITTYINGIQVQQLKNSTYPTLGKFGFRASSKEQFYADNFTVADASGTVLYREDFSNLFDANLPGTLKENQLFLTGNIGKAGNPDPVFFDTALYDAETIGALTEYTIEMDAKIVDRNLGIVFGAVDAKNCYMWSFMTSSTLSGSSDNLLDAHIRTNGAWKENRLSSGFNYTSTMKGKTVHLKIEVSNGVIKTYVGDVLVNTFENSQYPTLGRFGFRASYTSKHGAEEAYVDNFVVKAGIGANTTVVFEEDFNLGQLASNHYATVTNDDRLFVETAPSNGTPFFFSESTHAAGNAYYLEDYEIAFDAKITNDATCVTFGGSDTKHCYMWCFHTTQKKLLMHYRNGGGWVSIGSTTIPDAVTGGDAGFLNEDLHVQIKKSGDEISTYINGVLINTVTNTLFPTLGKVGFRASYSSKTGHETSYIDNFALKDCSGIAFYTQDFETLDLSEIFVSPVDCEIVTVTDGDGNSDKKLYLGSLATGDNIFFFDHTKIGISFSNSAAPMLRKEFALDAGKEIASARLYATATGVYETYINGVKVGDDYLNPGSTEFVDRAMYQTFDVTSMLKGGSNAISGTVGTGWYNGTRWNFGSVNALYARLVIRYTDGSEDVISTDGTWKWYGNGPLRGNDLIDGEDYDARYEVDGWKTDAFDDSNWSFAKVYTQSAVNVGSVSAQIGSTIKLVEERSPIAVTEPLSGVYVYDFGQNFSGIVRITATAPSGTVMTLRFAEMLNHADVGVEGCDGPAGTIYTENLRVARAADVYTFRGTEGGETYCPIFTYHGFRYLEVTGIDKDAIIDVTALVISSATGEHGTLETSNELVDQFYSNLKWGLLSNCTSIPTDCNQRNERHGWTSEAQVISRSATYIFDHYAFMRKYMQDIRDTQKADGNVYEIAPSRSGSFGATASPNSYGDAAVIIPWQMYQQYGDVTILEENWDCIKRYVQHLYDTSTDFIRDVKGYADWLYMGESTPTLYINTVWTYHSCTLAARIAAIVGTPEDVARFTEWAEGYKNVWTEKYLDATGHINVKTQTAYAMALEFGLVEGELAQNAADDLAAKVAANGYRLTTGTSGTSFLNPALSHNGYSDVAYKLLEQTECPSWLHMVTQGATTVWERWNSFTEEDGFGPASMNSFNHPIFGTVVEWIYRSMLGIERDEENPGYKHFFLQPEIGGSFTYARGSFDTSYGTIFSGWEISGDGLLTYTCTVPANTTATLRLPTPVSGVVREGNGLAKNAYGVTYVGIEGESVVYELESGSYSFTLQIADHYHTYDEEVATDDYKASDATCTDKAEYFYSCACGERDTTRTFESGELASHTEAAPVQENYSAPTYFREGACDSVVYCSVCDERLSSVPQTIAVKSSYMQSVTYMPADTYDKVSTMFESSAHRVTNSVKAYSFGSAPFAMNDIEAFKGSRLTSVSIPVYKTGTAVNGEYTLTISIFKCDNASLKNSTAVRTYPVKISAQKYGLTDNTNVFRFITVDLTSYNVIIDEDELMGFGVNGDTLYPAYLEQDSTNNTYPIINVLKQEFPRIVGFAPTVGRSEWSPVNHSLLFNFTYEKAYENEDAYQAEVKADEDFEDMLATVADAYAGKQLSVFGDSISTFVGISQDTTVNSTIGSNAIYYSNKGMGGLYDHTYTYWGSMMRRAGMKLCVNNAWSGDKLSSGRFVTRVQNLHRDVNTTVNPDLILVYFGINDIGSAGGTNGTLNGLLDNRGTKTEEQVIDEWIAAVLDKAFDDNGNYVAENLTTFDERYAVMLYLMTEKYSDARIACITLVENVINPHTITWVPQYNRTIRALANYYGALVVEQGNVINAENYMGYMHDKYVIHPNAIGHELIFEEVVRTLYAELAVQDGFVPTEAEDIDITLGGREEQDGSYVYTEEFIPTHTLHMIEGLYQGYALKTPVYWEGGAPYAIENYSYFSGKKLTSITIPVHTTKNVDANGDYVFTLSVFKNDLASLTSSKPLRTYPIKISAAQYGLAPNTVNIYRFITVDLRDYNINIGEDEALAFGYNDGKSNVIGTILPFYLEKSSRTDAGKYVWEILNAEAPQMLGYSTNVGAGSWSPSYGNTLIYNFTYETVYESKAAYDAAVAENGESDSVAN